MKYTRGFLLAGQIITLVAFAYLTFSFFAAAALLNANGYGQYASLYEIMGFFALLAVPFSIIGIVHSVKPYGEFKLWTPITSMVFDIIIGILLLNGMSQSTGVNTTNGATVIFMISVFAAVGLFIVGIIKGKKEMNELRSHQVHSTNSAPHIPSPDDFRFDRGFMSPTVSSEPTPAQPTVESTPTTAPSQTTQDLSKLKELHEQHLITDDEYAEKKKEILARAFEIK